MSSGYHTIFPPHKDAGQSRLSPYPSDADNNGADDGSAYNNATDNNAMKQTTDNDTYNDTAMQTTGN